MAPTQIFCEFFPIGFFFLFQAGFFSRLRSDSNVFVSCCSALFYVMSRMLGCSITYCYSSRCSAETTKINRMVFVHVVYCVVELKYLVLAR